MRYGNTRSAILEPLVVVVEEGKGDLSGKMGGVRAGKGSISMMRKGDYGM